MILIDSSRCTGCGLCVSVCFPQRLTLSEGRAVVKEPDCIHCGHCIAVCPQNAVSTDLYDMGEVMETGGRSFAPEPEQVIKYIKARRSIRHFKNRPVEEKKLKLLLEAGRYTPTGGNRQAVSYVVVQGEALQTLRRMALDSLCEIGRNILSSSDPQNQPPYAERWIAMQAEKEGGPSNPDSLFFHAPAVILIIADRTIEPALAASYMELTAISQGLGVLYSGFTTKAVENDPRIKELLGIPGGEQAQVCMVVGYPDIRFKRTAPRKKAQVRWL